MAMLSRNQMYTPGNVRRTASLIFETCRYDDKPIFTLNVEREGYISLQNLYIKYCVDDPTENTFAEEVFGSLEFWLNMKTSKQLGPLFEPWKELVDIKRKQLAFQVILKEVKEEGKNSFQAAKYLIEEPWKKGVVAKRKAKETTKEAFSTSVQKDAERLKESGYLQ